MILTTTEFIAGRTYSTLGMVRGSTIQSKHIGKDIGASFKTIVGGELTGYTEMLNEAREIAVQRMVAQAASMGADAIATSAVMQGAAEVIAYGTAVKLN